MQRKTIRIRRFWKIKPATRIEESAKVYSRKKAKRNLKRALKKALTNEA